MNKYFEEIEKKRDSSLISDDDFEDLTTRVGRIAHNYNDELLETQIGIIDGIRICLVNGRCVEKNKDMDFVEAGHDLVYKYIPTKTIWIDLNLDAGEFKYLIVHEFIERKLMSERKLTYAKAHKIASDFERKFRTLSA